MGLIVADPFDEPQVAATVVEVAVGAPELPMFTFAVVEHPFASVTVTT